MLAQDDVMTTQPRPSPFCAATESRSRSSAMRKKCAVVFT